MPVLTPDKQLAADIQHVISMHVQNRDIRTATVLMSLMLIAREWIRAGKLSPEAETFVLRDCVRELTGDKGLRS